jgi:signal peptide peptidase SppA
MNTPGGTVVDSDNIYRMLREYKARYKVPVFAYVDGLCASGGMYISCAADQVFAGPASMIGSVGVIIGPFFNIFDTLGKVGILSKTITEGLDKDMMSPFRPWKTDEDASLKAVTSFFYQQFVNIVLEAKPRMDRNKLVQEYGAKVFDSVTAQRYGYVDQAESSRDATLLALLKEANVDPATTYQVIELEPKSEWISEIFNTKSPLLTGKIEHTLDTGLPCIREKVAYLYEPMGN